MKKWFFLILLIPISASGEIVKQVPNPWTGRPDFITSLGTTSLNGAGVFGQVIVKHADGTQVSYSTTSTNENDKGQMLLDALALKQNLDHFYLSAGTFNVTASSIDMTLNGFGHIDISGMGRDSTLLRAVTASKLLNPGSNSDISELTLECNSVSDFCLPAGTEDRGSTNVAFHSVRFKAPRDLVYTDNQTPVIWNFYDCLFNDPEFPKEIKAICMFAIKTGLRQGELRDLKWADIDFKNGLIRVPPAKSVRARFVPMHPQSRQVLEEAKRYGEFVFSNVDGSKLSRHGIMIRKGFESACKRLGIKNLHFHDLRHTFASDFIMAGGDLVTLAEYMGHTTTKMSERYAHLSPQYRQSKIALLPQEPAYSPRFQVL